jgi:hypothetical protein
MELLPARIVAVVLSISARGATCAAGLGAQQSASARQVATAALAGAPWPRADPAARQPTDPGAMLTALYKLPAYQCRSRAGS